MLELAIKTTTLTYRVAVFITGVSAKLLVKPEPPHSMEAVAGEL